MSHLFDNERLSVVGKQHEEEEINVVSMEYLGLVANVFKSSYEECAVPRGATVGMLLQKLVERHGQQFNTLLLKPDGLLRPIVEIYLDGDEIRSLGGLETPIPQNARVSVMVGVYPVPGR